MSNKKLLSTSYVTHPYSSARKQFPKMPEEIFKLWLDDMIKANGWPPYDEPWIGILREKPIEYWTKLEWEKYPVKINKELLTESSKEIIDGLFYANFGNEDNAYSRATNLNSMQRFTNIMSYIKDHSKLPNPLIFIEEDEQYEIVDGSHRLTIFFQLRRLNLLEDTQEAWIGKIK